MENNRLHLQNIRSIDVFSADTSNYKIAKYFDNGYAPKLPDASDLEYGEIALNIHKGNEVLAIKNYDGDVIFIPFNIAEKLFQLNANYEQFKAETVNYLGVFSANTLAHFDSVEELIYELSANTGMRFLYMEDEIKEFSALTDEHFSEIENKINNLSADTQSKFDDVNKRIDDQEKEISGITSQIEDISGKVVAGTNERLQELSAYTLAKVDENYREHDNIRSEISAVSGDLTNKISDIYKFSGQTEGILSGVTELIYQLSASTDIRFSGNTIEHEELQNKIEALSGNIIYEHKLIEKLSGSSLSGFSDVTNLIHELSASTDVRFSGNTIEHEEINERIDNISGSLATQIEKFKDFSGSTNTNISGITNLIYELSAITDVRFSGNTVEHEEINEKIDAISGTLITHIENTYGLSGATDAKVSGLTELIYELSASTDVRFSGNTIEHEDIRREIESVSGELETEITEGLENLDDKYGKVTSATTKLVENMNESLGFDEEGDYNPYNENLQNKNVSESIDYIDDKIDSHISAYTAQIQDLLKIILEDETVTANFAATINNSLGFTIHAKYNPLTDIIKGMDVTEAIDTIYKKLEDDINNLYNKIMSGATEGMATLDDLADLELRLKIYIDAQDKKLSDRIDALEALLNSLDKYYLEQAITYDRLVELYRTEELRKGILYRLTNYQAEVNHDKTELSIRKEINRSDSNANSGFDILIRATSNKTLNENCMAMVNPANTEFESQHPDSWNIKYSLLNDNDRFDWAQDDGFGVIYYMKDGNGNEAPYDFKNIMYNGKYAFGGDTDESGTEKYHNNVIRPIYENGLQCINNVIFECDKAEANILAAGCKDINISGTMKDNLISNSKNNSSISNKENKLIGYTCD